MKIFGGSSVVYYIFPCLTGIAGSLLIYRITTRLSTRLAGLTAFLIFSLYPLTTRETTQFLPMLPAGVLILAAIYFLLNYLEQKKLTSLLWSGLMILLSYGCKVTSLYWALAFVLFIAIYGIDTKYYFKLLWMKIGPGVIVFSLTIVSGLVIETLLINHFFDFTYGRLQVISSTHLTTLPEYTTCGFFTWLFSFTRPFSLHGKYFETIPCLFVFAAGLISALLCWLKGSINKKFMAFTILLVFLIHCYIVYKVFPFHYPEKAHSRYLMLVALACIIMFCISQNEWNKAIWSKIRNVDLARLIKTVLALVWILNSLIYIGNNWMRNGTIISTISAGKIFAQAESQQHPLLLKLEDEPKEKILCRSDRKNALRWMTFYGPDRLIPQLSQMPFPSVTDAKGKKYILLLNADKLSDQHAQDVLIIEEADIYPQNQSFKKSEEAIFITAPNQLLLED
jgi:4-amino-4-deoxy-L-arabinose transferase-like glycosyltransferase